MLNFFAYIQKQPLLLLIVSAGVMVAGMVLHSKTTFVTINLYSSTCRNGVFQNSKTTFVTINPPKIGVFAIIIYYSKTTFVTINPTKLIVATILIWIQKQPLLLLIKQKMYLENRIHVFKNNLCYY